MSYTVHRPPLAPQTLDQVRGPALRQQTPRNAENIASGRITSVRVRGAQGGKTTTRRILARMLTARRADARPCGACDPSGRSEGRDMDVLEIDAATQHAGEKVRDVIIAGLGSGRPGSLQGLHHRRGAPALGHSFTRCGSRSEEPPPHVASSGHHAATRSPHIVSRCRCSELRPSRAASLGSAGDDREGRRIDASPEASALVAPVGEAACRSETASPGDCLAAPR